MPRRAPRTGLFFEPRKDQDQVPLPSPPPLAETCGALLQIANGIPSVTAEMKKVVSTLIQLQTAKSDKPSP